MNSCAYYQELISSLVDGELSDEENEALMLHLNTCSRCNAMYAVFHDLSDILSEEPAPLPEGLHENIMAGVRRSELKKRSRRMRRVGLRTALTAAACAVLVLFAAVSFDPGKRADSVSIRTEEAASQLLPSQAPADMQALPAATPVPAATPAPLPAQTPVPVYDTTGTTATYTPVQPEPHPYTPEPYPYNNDTYIESAPLPAWTPAPVQTQAPVWTPAPTENTVWNAAPAAVETPAPAVFVPAPAAEATAPVQSAEPAAPFFRAASESVTQSAEAAGSGTAAEPEPETAPEESVSLFSFFTSMNEMFDAGPAAPLEESKLNAPASLDLTLDSLPQPDADTSVLSGIPLEPAAVTAAPVQAETVTVYGSQSRERLLAMIGHSEDSLPQEAELTRLVHVSFRPDDAYGSEEKMDISIYRDFVYCSLYPVGGGSVTYRADCSLKELDGFLAACMATPAPSASPTPDPYTAPTPVPVPEPGVPESVTAE